MCDYRLSTEATPSLKWKKTHIVELSEFLLLIGAL